jgi:hypothetical protein
MAIALRLVAWGVAALGVGSGRVIWIATRRASAGSELITPAGNYLFRLACSGRFSPLLFKYLIRGGSAAALRYFHRYLLFAHPGTRLRT